MKWVLYAIVMATAMEKMYFMTSESVHVAVATV